MRILHTILVLLALVPAVSFGFSKKKSGLADSMGIELKLEKKTLSNGLTVILVEDHTVPIVSYQSWFRVGSVDERAGITGISHLFEHLMFKGTPKYGAKQFFYQLEAKGADVNAFTTRDYTVYHEDFVPTLLEKVIDMESDRLQNLILDDATLASERQVVFEERRLRTDNTPEGRMQEAIWQLAYHQHPYRWPVIGYPEDLSAITTEQLREYFKSHYQPRNLALVIVGDIDPKATFALVESYYGKIEGRKPPARKFKDEPEQSEERRLVTRDDIAAERFSQAYHVTAATDDDSYALDVLANILFEGTSSRAYRRIVDEKDLAVGVTGSAFTPTYPGLFLINGVMKQGRKTELAEAEIESLIKDVQEKGVTEAEIQAAVRQLTVQLVDSVRTPHGMAQLIGTVQMVFDDPDRFRSDLEKYFKVSRDDVKRVARKYLIPNNRSVVTLVPQGPEASKPGSRARKSSKSSAIERPEPSRGLASTRVASAAYLKEPGKSSLQLPVPQLETLPNGLEVAWFVDSRLPVIDLALMLKSGHRDDPSGKSGTSELLAESLDRGAGGMTAQQLSEAVEMLGASRYANAGDDTFTIGMHGLALDGARLLELLARMSLSPTLAPSEIERERARLLDRWAHINDYGELLAGLPFGRALAGGTSYGRGSLLSGSELERVQPKDVVAFHARHFTPKNSILMIVGRVDKDEFRKHVIEAFGSWKGEAPKREWKKYSDKRLPAHPFGKILLVDRPGLTQAQIRIGFHAPLIGSPDHYALVVANALLGETFTSRLNSLIRDQLGLTYGIASQFSYSQDLATFGVSSATANEHVGEALAKTREVLARAFSEPIAAGEVVTAKEYLVGGFPLANATLGAAASRWLSGRIYGLGPEYLNEFIPRVSSVTPEQVSAALKRNFRISQAVVVIAGDASKFASQLKGSKWGSVVRLKTRDLR